jgi:hypothetical protein
MHLSNPNIAMKTATMITIGPKAYCRYVSLSRAYLLIAFIFILVALALSLWSKREENHSCAWVVSGRSLSPQLFVLAMEVVTILVGRAMENGLLSPIGCCTAVQSVNFCG